MKVAPRKEKEMRLLNTDFLVSAKQPADVNY